MRTRLRAVAVPLLSLLAAPAVLAGCGGGGGQQSASSSLSASESPASSQSTAGTANGTDGATDAPPFPANAEPDVQASSPASFVTVSDIRLARQDGFDRVVFEVGGTGTPGWDVRYVEAASSQASGKPVDVAGSAILQVSLTGVGYPQDTGVEPYVSTGPLSAPGTKTVTEVVVDSTFEGTTVAFVGTEARAPFRVYLLENPTRVVLEVADA